MLPIQRKISSYNYSTRNGNSVKYIVLHYTGNKGDTAIIMLIIFIVEIEVHLLTILLMIILYGSQLKKVNQLGQ